MKLSNDTRTLTNSELDSDIQSRKEFFGITRDTEECLRSLLPFVTESLRPIIDRFYQHIAAFPEVSALLTSEELVEQLKKTQSAYLLEIFKGDVNEAYVRRRYQIGVAHERVGLSLRWYIGSYSYLLKLILNEVARFKDRLPVPFSEATYAISAIMAFDQTYAIDSYVHCGISKFEEANENLAALNEEKNKFLGMAAHELRNPLGSIRGFSEVLLEELKPSLSEDQLAILQRIYQSSESTLSIVNDFLNVSVIEGAGEVELKRELNILSDVIDSAIKTNQASATKKGISITSDVCKDLEPIYFDAEKITQVIDNFVSNAIKYSPKNTKILVETVKGEIGIQVKVSDEGPGIPTIEQQNLFKAFGKVGSKPTDGEKSTGLGLLIARKIVEAHKGRIWVESLGMGSTFCFELPTRSTDREKVEVSG